jgi:hypothetical protein
MAGYGSAPSKIVFISVKIAVFTRIPSASDNMAIAVGDSGEAERSFQKEAERHSGMIPNTIGA